MAAVPPSPTVIAVAVVFCVLLVQFLLKRRAQRRKALPPGPPGLPIVGNMFNIPTEHEWVTYTKWSKQYGKVFYMENLGQPIIVINSLPAAVELFETRSSKYSDKPDMVMTNDVMGLDWNFAFMRYGDAWRDHRKMFHVAYHPKTVEQYYPVQIRASRQFVDALLKTPDQFMDHVAFFTGSIILNITYGYRPKDRQDYYVKLSELSQELLNETNHELYLVDLFPILKHIPSWFPGAGFKRFGAKARAVNEALLKEPYERAKEDMMKGNPDPSFIRDQLAKVDEISDPVAAKRMEEVLKETAAVAYFAGADTVATALSGFLLAMSLHPEVQKKAQAEIDDLLHGTRLPDFKDKDELPYIRALVLEVLRWNPVTPLGIPHRCNTEDVYEGYRIPKDTMVIGNTWAILHDETLYGEDVLAFNPERFLPKDGKPVPPDPAIACFGYGRRICPGRHLALNNLFISVSSMLATFDILKALDKDGKIVEPKVDFATGTVSKPAPFSCRFVPRSEQARKLVLMEV